MLMNPHETNSSVSSDADSSPLILQTKCLFMRSSSFKLIFN